MSVLKRRAKSNESTERSAATDRSSRTERDKSVLTERTSFRLGRLLYGAILAFMAVDNLRNLEERIGYAESKGVPMPSVSVPAISSSLLVGSVGVALWRAPVAAASMVAAFFVGVTPAMHDFWAIDDDEQKQQQMLHFLKNGAILGAALAFLGIGLRDGRPARS